MIGQACLGLYFLVNLAVFLQHLQTDGAQLRKEFAWMDSDEEDAEDSAHCHVLNLCANVCCI